MDNKKHEVTPEEVIRILKTNGTIVTLEEAKEILVFMNKFAKLGLEKHTDSFQMNK